MIVKVQGVITAALQKRSGVSQMGNAWSAQEFVVSEGNNNLVCFDVLGDENISKFALQQQVDIDCVLSSREYNGRYYTSLRYLVPKENAQPQPQVQAPQQTIAPQPAQQTYQQPAQPQTQPQPQPMANQYFSQPQQAVQPQGGSDLPF